MHAEKRGYVQGPIMWQSHKKQKFNCTSCKRAFPRMEVLLQHLRDSSKHRCCDTCLQLIHASVRPTGTHSETPHVSCSQQPISREASLQMSNWLLAKDQRLHCCPTCCLGFQTETELYVHLKHTEVHKVRLLQSLPMHCVMLSSCQFAWQLSCALSASTLSDACLQASIACSPVACRCEGCEIVQQSWNVK